MAVRAYWTEVFDRIDRVLRANFGQRAQVVYVAAPLSLLAVDFGKVEVTYTACCAVMFEADPTDP